VTHDAETRLVGAAILLALGVFLAACAAIPCPGHARCIESGE